MKPVFVILTVKSQVGSAEAADPCVFNVNKIDSVLVGPAGRETRIYMDGEYLVLAESPTEVYEKITQAVSDFNLLEEGGHYYG